MRESIIRTVVPYLVGALLTAAAYFGLDIAPTIVTAFVAAVVGAVYHAVVRQLELRYPRLGRWLIAFGLTAQQPVYLHPTAAANRIAAVGR